MAIQFTMSPELPRRILKKFGFRGMGSKIPRHAFPKRMCVNAGVPSNSATADDPGSAGVLCLDETNDDIYISTSAYNSASDHPWTKIVD